MKNLKPEEIIRQKLVYKMSLELGYPKELICIEKQLKSMPHLKGGKFPDRRFDIVCFGKGIHPEHDIYPLIMIECKAHPLTKKVAEQVIGYNHHVKAYFVGIANAEEEIIGWRDEKRQDYCFRKGLLSYLELLDMIKLGGRSEK